MVQSGGLWGRLPRLRYVVVSAASGTVGSIVGQIAKIKVCCGQHCQWCSREHCGDRFPRLRYVVVSSANGAIGSLVGQIAKITVYGGQHSQWCSLEHWGTGFQD